MPRPLEIEDLERPASPSEAALHHEIETLKLQVQSLFAAMMETQKETHHLDMRLLDLERKLSVITPHLREWKERLAALEARRRPGDD